MTENAAPATVIYWVNRRSLTAWRDEDIAMSNLQDGPFKTLDAARLGLVDMLMSEIEGVSYTNAEWAVERRNSILAIVREAARLTPDETKKYDRVELNTRLIGFSITRQER